MNLKKIVLIVTSLIVLSLILSGCGSKKDNQPKQVNYPVKPIKIINFLPVGTPPDVMTRRVAGAMEKKYGWKFEFLNEPQNGGSAAVNDVWSASHDGYTVLAQTENMLSLSTQGLTKQTAKDWDFFEMFQETSALIVKSNSPYKNIQEIVEAAKAKPETIKVGATGGAGGSFNLKIAVLETVTGAKFVHKPYNPKEDIMAGLANNDVEAAVVPAALSRKEIADGSVRVLSTLDGNSYDFGGNVGKVESITKTYPDYKKYLPLDILPGLALPADVPKDIKDKFGKAFEEAMNSSDVEEYLTKIGALKINLWGDNVRDYMSKMESNYVWVSDAMGLTKVSPQSLGIQKPR